MSGRTLEKGQSLTLTREVTDDHLASTVGSGGLEVCATPALVTFAEAAAYQLAERTLEEGDTTVGTALDLRHLAPTPLGMQVRVTATVEGINGKQVRFSIEIVDEEQTVMTGTHQRVIVSKDRFMKRVADKQ